MPRDLTFTPAAKLGALYRARVVSPLEVMRAVLDRIDRVNRIPLIDKGVPRPYSAVPRGDPNNAKIFRGG